MLGEAQTDARRGRQTQIETDTHIYIYICCGVIIWTKFGLFNSYYLVHVCFVFNSVCQKKSMKRVSPMFFEQISAHANLIVIIWSKFAFLKRTLLGPDNNPTLDPKKTCKMINFAIFCFEDVLKYLFIVFLNLNQTLPKKGPKKRITFHI